MKVLLLCAMLLVLPGVSMAGHVSPKAASPTLPQPDWYMPPAPRTLAEFLISGQDVEVIATVLSAKESRRGFSRMPELMVCPVTEVQLQVSQVVYGVPTSTVIEMTLLDTGYNLHPQDVILAWGTYTPEDNWRLRGRCLRVDGYSLEGRPGEPAFVDDLGPRYSLPLSSYQSEDSTKQHPSKVYNGNRAIALMKLRGSSRWSERGAVFEVDSLGWAMGGGEATPRTITFPAQAGCFPGIYPGDSLLVPLPPGFRGRVLTLRHCPSALRIKDGFVPGLGTYLNDLNRSIEQIGPMLHVRSMQLQEK